MTVPMTSLEIRPYVDADRSAVLDLLRASLGGGPTGSRDPAFFDWKHRRSPFGDSFMLVAESEGALVGLRAFMRWRFEAGHRTISAVRAVDTATHPEHQGRGIFTRLTREALEALRADVDLVFNTPNGKSLPGYLKMGWQPVGTIPVSIRVRKPVRFARRARGAISGAPSAPDRPMPSIDAMPARSALHGRKGEIATLLESARDRSGRLRTPRDAAYFLWRYADAPGLGYHVVFDDSSTGLRAMAVFRVRARGSAWETTISEVVTASGDVSGAARVLGLAARAASVDHVACHASPGSATARAYGRSMFFPAPRGMTFVVNPLAQGLEPDPTRSDSWALSLGDVEVF
jgi:GNAT superfamily N-acetyltransferase